jgi:hypothetical protein
VSRRIDVETGVVIGWLRSEVAQGHLSKQTAEKMGKRFVLTGELAVKQSDTVYWVTREGLMCGCGKGVLCPLNEQIVGGRLRRLAPQRGGK